MSDVVKFDIAADHGCSSDVSLVAYLQSSASQPSTEVEETEGSFSFILT
jgi:hypothetical protein